MTQHPESGQPPVTIDATAPNPARIRHYRPGGKDHDEPGRQAGGQFSAICPGIADIARAAGIFPGRVVRLLAGEAGHRAGPAALPAPPSGRSRRLDRCSFPGCQDPLAR